MRRPPRADPRSRRCSSRRNGTGPRPATSAGGSAADWRQALLGPDGLRLDEWRAEGRLTTVKTGPAPGRLPRRPPRGRGLRQALPRARLPGDVPPVVPPRQGTQRGQAVPGSSAAIGVPTITPDRPGRAAEAEVPLRELPVTPEIPETVPLDEFVENRLPRLARAAAGRGSASAWRRRWRVLTARLHDAGFVHIDFHPGNILVRIDAGRRRPSWR